MYKVLLLLLFLSYQVRAQFDVGISSTSSLENPSFTFSSLQPDDYSVCLTALSTNGNVVCSDQICETISIADAFSMYVPNTFTPDNDSYNPVFLPVLSGNDIYEYNLTIFNRWGEILFESNNEAVGWDGTYGGEPVKDGTYIWRISAREIGKIKDVLFTGHVNVIR